MNLGFSFIVAAGILVLVGCFVFLLSRIKNKKAAKRAALILCAIAVGGGLAMVGIYFAPYLTSAANFSGMGVHGYTLGQVISADDVGLSCIECGGTRVTYAVQNTNIVYLRVDGVSNQIIEIDVYQNEDASNAAVQSQVGSLLVGASTREEVEKEHGTHYLQHIFVDGYQSRISYYDRTNHIELVFSFTGEVLEQIKLIVK